MGIDVDLARLSPNLLPHTNSVTSTSISSYNSSFTLSTNILSNSLAVCSLPSNITLSFVFYLQTISCEVVASVLPEMLMKALHSSLSQPDFFPTTINVLVPAFIGICGLERLTSSMRRLQIDPTPRTRVCTPRTRSHDLEGLSYSVTQTGTSLFCTSLKLLRSQSPNSQARRYHMWG